MPTIACATSSVEPYPEQLDVAGTSLAARGDGEEIPTNHNTLAAPSLYGALVPTPTPGETEASSRQGPIFRGQLNEGVIAVNIIMTVHRVSTASLALPG